MVLVALLVLTSSGSAGADVPTGIDPHGERRERRSATGGEQAPLISLIGADTPTCYRPRLDSSTCYINWAHMDVSTASPSRIVSLTLTIDGAIRANYQGFFQDALAVTSKMNGDGFRVPCGAAGVDGVANMGHRYDWVVRGLDSDGGETTSSGAVLCPSLDPTHAYIPVVLR
jgi:hypothetical protein